MKLNGISSEGEEPDLERRGRLLSHLNVDGRDRRGLKRRERRSPHIRRGCLDGGVGEAASDGRAWGAAQAYPPTPGIWSILTVLEIIFKYMHTYLCNRLSHPLVTRCT